MKPEDILNKALMYSEYSKGAEYSASDILSDPLKVKLRKKYPNVDDVQPIDKISAYIGTGTHLLFERFINSLDETNLQSEVRLKHKNLSGTADLIVDGNIICDLKTSKEANVRNSIKEPSKWVIQLSIYNFLNHKQNGVQMADYGYILWLSTDSRKFGTEKLKLLTKDETIEVIKEFMDEMKKPIEDTEKCKSCSWLWKWCSVRSECEYYQNNEVEEW